VPVIDIAPDSLGYPDTFSIIRWLVADGADVAWDQYVVEVENDKATFEIPPGYPGRLRITCHEGRDLPMNSVIGRLEVTDEVYAEYMRRQNLFNVTLRLTPEQWEALHRARGELSVQAYVHRLVENEVSRLQEG
jgi:pyruvate/2-oxoglutarate dehydrogenase complex dihydrolipoamide acyltransferase (E2) component